MSEHDYQRIEAELQQRLHPFGYPKPPGLQGIKGWSGNPAGEYPKSLVNTQTLVLSKQFFIHFHDNKLEPALLQNVSFRMSWLILFINGP